MTIKASGSISMSEINAEFALGTSLSSYRGATWYTDAGGTGTFPVVGQISMDAFYNKKKTSPVIYVQYILVGGGGGGAVGTYDNIGGGGGGGGGGGLYMNDVNLNPGNSFYVTIGQGGAAGYVDNYLYLTGYQKGGAPSYSPAYIRATAGGTTMVSGGPGTVTAGGGQPGIARWYWNGSSNPQESQVYKGGDGGYGLYAHSGTSTPGYIGWGPGNSGGLNTSYYGNPGASDGKRAGGGGAGSDDTNGAQAYGGAGGTWLDGVTYGGGGGGGADYSTYGAGGAGGGGHGGSGNGEAVQGVDGLGGGGGGGRSNGGYSYGNGGRGGSGRVVFRYWGTSAKATGGSIVYSGGYVYHTFTSNGTFTMS